MRTKYINDANVLEHEVGRGRGVLERSLEIADVLRGAGGGGRDRKNNIKSRWWSRHIKYDSSTRNS